MNNTPSTTGPSAPRTITATHMNKTNSIKTSVPFAKCSPRYIAADCKLNFAKLRLQTAGCISALFVLSNLLLAIENAQAQGCGNFLFVDGPVINPISGSRVIVGQTITIMRSSMGSANGNCLFRNGVAYYAQPDGNIVQSMQDISLDPNQTKSCPLDDGVGATCLPYPTTYVVSAADINRTLTIVLPPRGQFGGGTFVLPGQPGEVHFFGAGDIDGFDPNDPTNPTGAASGTSSQGLTVVSPGLTITKEFDTNCFSYGSSIHFHGTICNTGDVRLVNMTVTDFPSGPVSSNSPTTFAATTSLGNPFNPVLGLSPGECVNYFGVCQPAETGVAPSPPFTSTIIATGTAQGVFQNPTFSATNSTTCNVCPSFPCPQPPTITNPTIDEGTFSFSFPTEAGRSYVVEFNHSTLSRNWQTLTTFTGDGEIANVVDNMIDTQRFYRVKVECFQ